MKRSVTLLLIALLTIASLGAVPIGISLSTWTPSPSVGSGQGLHTAVGGFVGLGPHLELEGSAIVSLTPHIGQDLLGSVFSLIRLLGRSTIVMVRRPSTTTALSALALSADGTAYTIGLLAHSHCASSPLLSEVRTIADVNERLPLRCSTISLRRAGVLPSVS